MYKRPKRLTKFVSALLVFRLAFGSPMGMAQDAKGQKGKAKQTTPQGDATKKLTEEQKVAHLLDRITFGARPGDVEQVMKSGWEKYLDEQLRPDRISDQALEQRLKNIESIHLSNAELAKNYPPPQVLQQVLKDRGVQLPGLPGLPGLQGLGANVNQNQNAGQAPLTKKDAKQG